MPIPRVGNAAGGKGGGRETRNSISKEFSSYVDDKKPKTPRYAIVQYNPIQFNVSYNHGLHT